MSQTNTIPVDVVHLLPAIDRELMQLLRSLSPEQWQAQTIASQWKVKDVVAHLLDGNIRILSMLRDNYYDTQPNIKSYNELLDFLNGVNSDWVNAMKRVSPAMLLLLHEATGKAYCDYYASLDPFGKAGFAVNWAGENESRNWMHIAREYTEKWLHQQQVREAVNIPGLMNREYFYPCIDTFMLALPYTFRNTNAPDHTTVQVMVTGEAGGSWFITRANNTWTLDKTKIDHQATAIIIDPDSAWKLFSKSLRPADVKDKVIINGNKELGEVVLTMVSVMA
jgi:uncharacterized protein (TIGR03083 family)